MSGKNAWELQMYGSFCRFRMSADFWDFALKNGFRRNSIIGDQFRQNWLLNACPNKVKKMSADFGRIARKFGGIARNFGGITRTQHWLQICTAHDMKTLSRQNWKLSAILSIFARNFRIRVFLSIPMLQCNFARSSQKGFPRYANNIRIIRK